MRCKPKYDLPKPARMRYCLLSCFVLFGVLIFSCKNQPTSTTVKVSPRQSSSSKDSNLFIGWYDRYNPYDDLIGANNFVLLNNYHFKSGYTIVGRGEKERLEVTKSDSELSVGITTRGIDFVRRLENNYFEFNQDEHDKEDGTVYFDTITTSQLNVISNSGAKNFYIWRKSKKKIAMLYMADSSDLKVKTLLIDGGIIAKNLYVANVFDLNMDIESEVKNIFMTESYYDIKKKPFISLVDTINKKIDKIIISDKSPGEIDFKETALLRMTNCDIPDTATIDCNSIDTLYLEKPRFKDQKSTIIINKLSKRKTVLFLRNVNVGNLNVNYTLFHYQPFSSDSYVDENSWNSDVIANYKTIISSQEKLGNQQGIQDATIEMNVFEDKQLPLGNLLSVVKIWWNNYGFDRIKVVRSSTIVFLFFLLFNCFIFDKLLDVYEVSTIKTARNDSFDFKYKVLGASYRFLLCLLYSGFIFYGLKFEFNRLKIKNIAVIIWLIVQYIIGVISLAYIASLILNK